jgi:hypothetical protein
MSKEQPSHGGSAHSYFLGLIPGPQTMDGDWDVDGPNVVKRMEPRSLLAWMADAHRPQPIMADMAESVDDDV